MFACCALQALGKKQPYGGASNCVVSHAYSYPFGESLGAMLSYSRTRENSHSANGEPQADHEAYFWFDPISLNQHANGTLAFETLCDTFGYQIRGIGEVRLRSRLVFLPRCA